MHTAPAEPVAPDASQIMRNGRWLTGVREKIFAGQESPLRDVIAASWQRSMAHGLRPDRRSSGVPTSSSSRPSAREIPDCVTASSSLTSVTVEPSATCLNQRSTSASMIYDVKS